MLTHRTQLTTAAAAAAFALQGAILAVDEQSSESTTVGIEHLSLAAFSLSLVLVAPLLWELGRHAVGGRFAAVGTTVLGLLAIISNVRGSDPSFFAAVAAPANLVWLGGSIAAAVVLRADRRFLVLPLIWVGTIPMGPIGGGLLAAAILLALQVSLTRTARVFSSPGEAKLSVTSRPRATSAAASQ